MLFVLFDPTLFFLFIFDSSASDVNSASGLLRRDDSPDVLESRMKGRIKDCNSALGLPITRLIAAVCHRESILSLHMHDFRLLLQTK